MRAATPRGVLASKELEAQGPYDAVEGTGDGAELLDVQRDRTDESVSLFDVTVRVYAWYAVMRLISFGAWPISAR